MLKLIDNRIKGALIMKKLIYTMIIFFATLGNADDQCAALDALFKKAHSITLSPWLQKRMARLSSPCAQKAMYDLLQVTILSDTKDPLLLQAPYASNHPFVRSAIAALGLDQKAIADILNHLSPSTLEDTLIYLIRLKCSGQTKWQIKDIMLPEGESICALKQSVIEAAHKHHAPHWFYGPIARQQHPCLLHVANTFLKHIERGEHRLDSLYSPTHEAIIETIREYGNNTEHLELLNAHSEADSLAAAGLLAQQLVCMLTPENGVTTP
jgi:hypothetical protein